MANTIGSLPDCILEGIFLLALEPNLSTIYTRQAPNKKAPWNIAAVSRSWRQIALSTRRLWTNIDVEDSHTCKRVKDICIVQFPIICCYRQLKQLQLLPLNVDMSCVTCKCNQSVLRIAAAQCQQ
ncbi:hypothetical protein BDV98DRAFT_568908 [Pterulicium gracile]|uniref:Uncharacterized protein n=1 Tax=Pterulicium gracile TaxID=1884261 RepID=A0A5C3QHE4_9AGAR|nr:hypothetical protein BDV98DRAFT_568908 [Pterula gracilis]